MHEVVLISRRGKASVGPSYCVKLGYRGKRLIEPSIVAGSCRSFPQDSWRFVQFYPVKRMTRGIGDETFSTYSQTLNG